MIEVVSALVLVCALVEVVGRSLGATIGERTPSPFK
nr:TPA_asm: m13.5 sORF 4 [Murid betaherpesvirus 1]DBA07922.1 TPA_asm: m13.5 sORF 4 [Murid betaherpesvirus 1]